MILHKSGLKSIIFFLLICLSACEEEDRFLRSDEFVSADQDIIEWRQNQNQWIFNEMKNNYFWADRLLDSTDYDYFLEPSLFFEEMLVKEDRFSYCKLNEEYSDTKTIALNRSVLLDTVYQISNHRIGYLVYADFGSEADVTDVILKFKKAGITDLIIDLRNNPGGYVVTAIHLSSLIVPIKHLGKVFSKTRYNQRITAEILNETGEVYDYDYFNDDYLTHQRNLNLGRVVVIVNGYSASCSELIVNCLKPYMEVFTIGERTVGKDVGMRSISNRRYKYELYPITFRTYNAVGDSVSIDGMIPNFEIKDYGISEDGNQSEPLLKKALEYLIEN